MGMKFHKFYVAVLNPLGIILVGIVVVLLLLVALNANTIADTVTGEITDMVTEEVGTGVNIPIFGDFEVDAVLWALFAMAAAVFVFMLITEFLLVARKKFGIIMLSLSLILGIASNVVSFARYMDQTPWYTLLISIALSTLILAYYWRRYKTFA